MISGATPLTLSLVKFMTGISSPCHRDDPQDLPACGVHS
jgi:hypothetical protein